MSCSSLEFIVLVPWLYSLSSSSECPFPSALREHRCPPEASSPGPDAPPSVPAPPISPAPGLGFQLRTRSLLAGNQPGCLLSLPPQGPLGLSYPVEEKIGPPEEQFDLVKGPPTLLEALLPQVASGEPAGQAEGRVLLTAMPFLPRAPLY